MQTQVINIRNAPSGWQSNPDYVYIGRANSYYGVQSSKWANPFPINKSKSVVAQREWVVRLYAEMLLGNKSLLSQLGELNGKKLICYCAPKLCHGHVLYVLSRRDWWQQASHEIVRGMFGDSHAEYKLYDIAGHIKSASELVRDAFNWQSQYTDMYAQSKIVTSQMDDRLRDAKVADVGTTETRRNRLNAQHAYDDARNEQSLFGGYLIHAQAKMSHAETCAKQGIGKWQAWRNQELERKQNKPLYVAIVGSRDYPSRMDVVSFVRSLPLDTVIVSGGARGVDLWAQTCAESRDMKTLIFPADWKTHGRGAGYRRNADIVKHADIVVAFWDGKSKGTQHSMQLAKKQGKLRDWRDYMKKNVA